MGCLRYFHQRSLCTGVVPEPAAYAIRQCGHAKDLMEGKRVHAQLMETGHDRMTFIGNLLVQMYGKCGCLAEARMTFGNICEPSVYSWNIMLSAYAQNGHLEEAVDTFLQMPEKDTVSWNAVISAHARNGCIGGAIRHFGLMDIEGMQPDRITFINLLDACGRGGDIVMGKAAHDEIRDRCLESDVAVATAVLNMYGKCGTLDSAACMFEKIPANVVTDTAMVELYARNGYLQDAKDMFDSILELNVVSWTTMLVAYAQDGQLQESKILFEKMPERDVISWNKMIDLYAEQDRSEDVIKHFNEMVREGVEPDSYTYTVLFGACKTIAEGIKMHENLRTGLDKNDVTLGTSLIRMYGKYECLDRARMVFDSMMERSLLSWNAMIIEYAKHGYVLEACNMFEAMPEHNIMSWNALIAVHAMRKEVDEAQQLFERMPQRNAVSWNTLTSAYITKALGDDALNLLKQMDLEGDHPDKLSLINAIDACAITASLPNAKLVLYNFEDAGFDIIHEEEVATSLMNMYCKCKRLDDAIQTFEAVVQKQQHLQQRSICIGCALFSKYA